MLEVNFDENKNLENDIRNSKLKKSEMNIYKILSMFFITMAVLFVLTYESYLYNILEKICIILPTTIITTGFYTVMGCFGDIANETAKKRSIESLKSIVKVLSKNKIKTNVDELSNSIIIKKTNNTKIVKNNDTVREVSKIKTVNKYYLFKDNDSKIQGLLEKKESIHTYDNFSTNLNYYILEKEDLDYLSNNEKKVKKLVKRN